MSEYHYIEPINPFAKTYAAVAEQDYYRSSPNYEECLRNAELSINYDSRIYEGHFYKAKALLKLGRYQEAEDASKKCLELDPKRPEAYPVIVYNK